MSMYRKLSSRQGKLKMNKQKPYVGYFFIVVPFQFRLLRQGHFYMTQLHGFALMVKVMYG